MTSTVDNPALASVHWQTTLVGSDRDHDHTRSSGGLTFDDLLAMAAEYQTGTGHTPRENPQQTTAPRPKNVMSLEAILSPVSSDYSSPSTGSGNYPKARGPTNSARQTPQPQLESSAHVPDQPQPCRVTTSPILPILVHPTPARRSLSIHPRPPPFTAPYIAPLPAPSTRPCSHAAHRKVESWAHPSSSTISGWTPPTEEPSISHTRAVDPPGAHLWRYNRHDRQDQIVALAEAQSIEDALALLHHDARTVPTTAPRGGIAPSLAFAITNAMHRERTCTETDSARPSPSPSSSEFARDEKKKNKGRATSSELRTLTQQRMARREDQDVSTTSHSSTAPGTGTRTRRAPGSSARPSAPVGSKSGTDLRSSNLGLNLKRKRLEDDYDFDGDDDCDDDDDDDDEYLPKKFCQ